MLPFFRSESYEHRHAFNLHLSAESAAKVLRLQIPTLVLSPLFPLATPLYCDYNTLVRISFH